MTTHGRSLVAQAADALVYAPLGFALEAKRVVPQLAARGRRQIVLNRTVGKYAVRRGRERLDALVATGVALVTGAVGAAASDDAAPTPRPVAARPVPVDHGLDPDALAIPEYDSLSAFQVVPRLEALESSDLDEVRRYEEATRGRRTILNKIDQLSAV